MRSIRHLPDCFTIVLTDGRWEQSLLRVVQQEKKKVFLSLIKLKKKQKKQPAALSDEKQQGNATVYKVL